MNLPNSFKTYLKLQSASPVTIRNYMVDINHFLGWLELKIRSRNLSSIQETEQLIRLYFTTEFIGEYKKFLLANSFPSSTINRRLSALRTFGKFCLSQAWISENPARKVINVTLRGGVNNKATGEEKILNEFKKSLEAQKTSPNTIKNYLSDIRGFLTFVDSVT